jgi:uncharacterized LabA/DUF88 family protein
VTNYAFIDGQNLYSGIRQLGWELDTRKFRAYLGRTYGVARAFYFVGYLPQQQGLYRRLGAEGYDLVFKPVVPGAGGMPKGNVDADLVLRALVEAPNYDQAVLVTGDGDFYSLVRHLRQQQKLRAVLSPNRAYCSALLKQEARGRLWFVEDLRRRLQR